jgi:predicted metal-dependent peptidase
MDSVLIDSHKIAIAKAKRKAAEWMPYLQSVFGPMRCTPNANCPTASVDKYGRMTYNPEFVSKLSVEVLAYVILHETLHIVLSHCQRREKLIPGATRQQAYLHNIAADLCIQQTLADEVGEHEPEGIVTLEGLRHIPGIYGNRTSEQYYEALEAWQKQENKEKEKARTDSFGIPSDDDDDDDDSDFEWDEDEDEDDAEDGNSEQDDGTTDDAEDGDSEQDGGGSDPSDGDADGEGDSEDESDCDGEGGKGQGKPDPSNSSDGNQSGDGGERGEVDTTGLPDFGDVCNPAESGSNSDGVEKEWEEDPTIADIASIENRLREVEQKMDEFGPCIGSGAGYIRQTLKARLHPMPDPFDQLKQAVARSIASPVGTPELTYRKWPRRSLPGKARLRGVQRYQPEATILLDTSGSMLSSDVQKKALAIVAKGISRLQNPRIVCCDGAIQSAKRVANMNNFSWDGGGGTDMAGGLVYVDKTYKPDSIVIITDGITGWPATPTRARVICALCRPEWASRVPKWITTVHLYRKGDAYVL